jgi:hypothetical protein
MHARAIAADILNVWVSPPWQGVHPTAGVAEDGSEQPCKALATALLNAARQAPRSNGPGM